MKNTQSENMYHLLMRLIHAQEAERERQREFLLASLGNYTFTQLHILACIDEYERVNNRVLTDHLGITKAAISKAVNQLIQNKKMVTYQIPENQKSIFYQLTPSGKKLAKAHGILHQQAEAQYRQFLQKFDDETLAKTQYFMDELILFLEQKAHSHD